MTLSGILSHVKTLHLPGDTPRKHTPLSSSPPSFTHSSSSSLSSRDSDTPSTTNTRPEHIRRSLTHGSFRKTLYKVIGDDGHVLQLSRPPSARLEAWDGRDKSEPETFVELQFGEEKKRKMERIRGVLELSDDLTISADEEISSMNDGTQAPAESATSTESSPSATITSPIASLFQLDMEPSTDCTRNAGVVDDVPEDSWRFLNSGQSAHHDMHCAYCREMNQELTFVDSFVAKVLDHYRESTATDPDSDKASLTTDPLQKQHAAALASKLAVTKAIVETEMEKRKVHEKLKEMGWHEYQKYYRTVEDKVMQRAIKRAEARIVANSGPHDHRLRELRELERSYNLGGGGGGAKKKPQKQHHSSPRQGRYQKAIAKDLDRVDDCVIV